MIKDAVATGATIEEAQQAAVLALNAPITADVCIEVLTMPEKKKFGLFGGKLAEVRAYYEVPDEPVKDQKKAKAPKANKPQEKKAPKKEAPKADAKKETKAKTEQQEKVAEAPKKAPKKVEKPAPVAIALEECPDPVKKAYDYLLKLIDGIGVQNVTVSIAHTEKEYFFSINSEDDYSLLIGRRGETLDALQYLVRLAANHGKEEAKFAKISLNVGNYREKRENTLKEFAKKNGRRVRKYGRNVTLDPMNPFERRIIHTAIAEMEGLTSYSIGADADRRVVISLAEGVKPLQEGGNRGGNRGGRGRNDRRGGSRAPKAGAPAAPARAPRADAAGVRYGKIEARAAAPVEAPAPAPETDA